MKTQSFTHLLLFALFFVGIILPSQLLAQCSHPNPTEGNQHPFQLDWEGKWNHVSLYGDWGEDYFSFYAETGNTYVFSTMSHFGGNIVNVNNNDTQFSILDANNQAAPGLFGNAFHDDFAPYYGDYSSTFAWSPSQSGTYRLMVTTYDGFLGGCQELVSGQAVTVAFRRIPETCDFAVWTGDSTVDWGKPFCWLSRGQAGAPGMGLQVPLSQAYVVIDSDGGASLGVPPTHVSGPYSETQTVSRLVIGPRTLFSIHPGSALKISEDLSMPTEWPPFAFFPNIGRIESTDANFPGNLHIIGNNTMIAIPNIGQLQNLNLFLESGRSIFINGISNLFEGESVFNNIELKGTGHFHITGKVRVKNKIHFHSDQVICIGNTDPYSYLKLEENTQIIGANEHRYFSVGYGVHIIKKWSSTQPFELPLGHRIVNADYYAPIKIEPTSGNPVEWSCAYFQNNLNNYNGFPLEGGIDHVSQHNKWKISTDVSNTQAKITLQWNASSSVSHQINDLVVTGFGLSSWHNLGGNNPTGGPQGGLITSNIITPNQFQELSLASTTTNHGFRLGQQPIAEVSFSCFPNPASNYTQIKLSNPAPTALSLRLLDAKGSIVHGIEIPAGQTEAPVQMSHLSSGIYYLISDGPNQTQAFKLIKE